MPIEDTVPCYQHPKALWSVHRLSHYSSVFVPVETRAANGRTSPDVLAFTKRILSYHSAMDVTEGVMLCSTPCYGKFVGIVELCYGKFVSIVELCYGKFV